MADIPRTLFIEPRFVINDDEFGFDDDIETIRREAYCPLVSLLCGVPYAPLVSES